MRFSRDKKPATIAGLPWELKELLVDAGWTVTQSSDGTTYNATGDQLAAETDLDNDLAWFVVQSPAGREFCWQTSDPASTPEEWRLKYSPAEGFGSGAPDATTTPTGTDEVIMVGGGTDAAPTFDVLFNASAGSINFQAAAQDGGEYGWWMLCYLDATAADTLVFCDPMVPGSYPTEDGDPVVVCARSSATATQFGSLQTVGTTLAPLGLLDTTYQNLFGLNYEHSGARTLPAGNGITAVANPFNARQETAPVIWQRPSLVSPNGWKGVSQLLRWNGGSNSSGSRVTIRSDYDHVVFGHLVLDWDGGAEPANPVAGTADVSANDFGRPGPYAEIHGVSPASGASLGATFDNGRWTPIDLTVRKGSATLPLIWGKLSSDGFAWLVIHDGTDFAPLFATTSSVTPSGENLVYSILPLGGWTASPEIYVGEFAEVS